MALGQPGLSLIELLIVAATLLIMATIAIPNFLKPKMGANQAFAVGSLKMIVSGEVSCPATYSIGSSSALGVLDGAGIRSASASAGLIDIVLARVKRVSTTSTVNRYVPDDLVLSGDCAAPITLYEVSGNPSGGAAFGNYLYADPPASFAKTRALQHVWPIPQLKVDGTSKVLHFASISAIIRTGCNIFHGDSYLLSDELQDFCR